MINKKIFLLLGLTILLFASSCSSDDDETIYGNWVQSSQFDGYKRSGAASFTIITDTSETAYLGLGYNGSRTTESQYFSDFLSYEAGSTSWTEQAPFPGDLRQDAFSFSVNGKGYIGCGYYGDTAEVYFSDVWMFDPTVDSASQWTPLPDFIGGELTEMTSFVVGGKAYVTGGRYESDGTKKDCYEFDPLSGTFTKIGGMNFKRSGAFSFVIENETSKKAYVGGGYDNSLVPQMECFDAETGTWLANNTIRALYLPSSITDDTDDYDDPLDLRRRWAVTFVVDGKAYLTSGNNGSLLNDCWEYDPSTDIWTEKNSYEYYMTARQRANSFTLGGLPFVLMGQSGSGYLDDMWSFEPNVEEDEND